MSKYIPGNQKHLTLNDRIYIENELSKGATFKDIAAFLCKDPTTISKEVRSRRLSDWYHKGTPVEKSFSAVSNAHPVQPATRPVRISKRNGAADLIGHLMYAMVVQ